MDKNNLNVDFVNIGELYVIYKNALLDKEKNFKIIETTKEKIVEEFWKITQKVRSFSPEMKEDSVSIVKAITSCLKTYTDKEPEEFCKLTFASIKKSVSRAASTLAFVEKTGMHITDQEDRKRKKIEKAYKQYACMNKDNKYAFIEYAEVYLGFSREDLETYLFPATTLSLFVINNNGEEYSIGDSSSAKNVLGRITQFPDTCEFEAQLKIINETWLKQKEDSKLVLSVAITVDLLVYFSKALMDVDLLSVLQKFDFIDKKILSSFFKDKNYKLPTQTEIGVMFNLSKSGVSVKVTRFIKSIKK